jgi:hypothetical protein
MFSALRPRHCLGAAALFSALAVGCESTHHKSSSDHCNACNTCSPCTVAAAPAKPAAPAPAKSAASEPAKPAAPAPSTPAALPQSNAYDSLPPVSNERYTAPRTPGIVITQKPVLESVPAPLPSNSIALPPAPVPAPAPQPPAAVPQSQVSIPPAQCPEEIPARRSFPDITARPEFAHSADYSSLTGTLSYIPQKHQWRLRFASIDEEDRYGGSVTLDVGQQMKAYHDGQIVKIDGQLADQDSREPSPLFHVKDVTAVR